MIKDKVKVRTIHLMLRDKSGHTFPACRWILRGSSLEPVPPSRSVTCGLCQRTRVCRAFFADVGYRYTTRVTGPPLRTLPPATRHKAKQERRLLREGRTWAAVRDRHLPSFLACSPRCWASLIASGIISGQLGRCCARGCVRCNFIGWRRIKPGTIINIAPAFYSTFTYGVLTGVSYKTVARRCDAGKLVAFRLPRSTYRYVLGVTLKEVRA